MMRGLLALLAAGGAVQGHKLTASDRYAERARNESAMAAALSAPQPLKIFASTYNAGNAKWATKQSTTALITEMVAGHEQADIAIMGFQEYKSQALDGASIPVHISEQLWRGQSAANSHGDVYKKMLALVTQLLEAVQKDGALASDVEQNTMMRKLTLGALKCYYSKLTAEEPDEVDCELGGFDASKLFFSETDYLQGVRQLMGTLSEQLNALLLAAETEGDMHVLTARFVSQSGPLDRIIHNGKKLKCCCGDAGDVEGSEARRGKLSCKLLGECKTLEKWLLVADNPKMSHLIGAGECMVPKGGADEALVQYLPQPLAFLFEALAKAVDDVEAGSLHDLEVNVQSLLMPLGVDHNGADPWEAVRQELEEDLVSKPKALADNLVNRIIMKVEGFADQLTSLDLAHGSHVRGATSIYISGSRCSLGNHFDTGVHVYLKPNSAWEFTLPPMESRGDKFILDFGTFPECGKVVNFVLVKAKHSETGVTANICAMNTHMSFAKAARKRAEYIEAATKEAKNRGCDTFVFVGDFNSRLHCEDNEECAESCEGVAPGGAKPAGCTCTPIFDHYGVGKGKKTSGGSGWYGLDTIFGHSSKGSTNSTPLTVEQEREACFEKCRASSKCPGADFCPAAEGDARCVERQTGQAGCSFLPGNYKNLVDTFCADGSCKLTGGLVHHDELTHFLRHDLKVACYETAENGGYQLDVRFPLFGGDFGMDVREAAPITFGPTYKVLAEGERVKEGYNTFDDNGITLFSDGVAKHNFAWTDRIIVGTVPRVTLTTEAYNSVKPSHLESDHLPVVAIMTAQVAEA